MSVNMLFAEGPEERYYIEFGDSLKVILKQTKGILTVTSKAEGCDSFTLYEKTNAKFKEIKKIDVNDEAVPVSNMGYSTPSPLEKDRVQSYRFPVINKETRFIQIIYDATKNLSAWLSLDDIEKIYRITLVMFTENRVDKIPLSADIYRFTNSGKRKMYKNPNANSSYEIISKDNPQYTGLRIIEIKNGFAHIVRFRRSNTDSDIIEPMGWVRIWDDKGMLLIWLFEIESG